MKYLIPALFFCFLSFSQTKDSIYSNAKSTFSFNSKLISISNLKPNFHYQHQTTDNNLFSVYNRNTKLNDVFLVSEDKSYYVKSVNENANEYLQKDSFNPNGINNFGAGLIMGSINTVLNFLK